MKYEVVHEFPAKSVEMNIYKLEICFRVKPLNKISYPGLKISRMIILQPEYAKSVIVKKTKRKLDLYLTFLASDDDDDATEFVLDDLKKFKELIFLRYSKFLSKSELAKLLKEVSFIESRLKIKLYENDKEISFGRNR